MAKTIVTAMSGGVDSSVVAAIMHEQGYKVIGITLQLHNYTSLFPEKKGSCCAGKDIYDAKEMADTIGIPHYVLNYEKIFQKKVIDDFVDTYLKGETPLPCVRCNQFIKFNSLLNFAKELGADALATGHYVQKVSNSNTLLELHRGLDPYKDQSYFLFSITNEQLEFLEFPLGKYTKEETRRLAKKYGLKVADKPDSQDICFVQNMDYRKTIERINPQACKPGKFVHIDGFELGEHKGIINYTVGQRRGLGISYGKAIYVTKIDPEKNIVYIGPESALLKNKFLINGVNWLANDINTENIDILAKIRSTSFGVRAKIKFISADKIEVTTLDAEKAITPGQACVLYDDTRVLGGGWITTY